MGGRPRRCLRRRFAGPGGRRVVVGERPRRMERPDPAEPGEGVGGFLVLAEVTRRQTRLFRVLPVGTPVGESVADRQRGVASGDRRHPAGHRHRHVATDRGVVEPYVNFLRSLPPLAYFGCSSCGSASATPRRSGCCSGAAFPPITLATIAGVRGFAATASTPRVRSAPPAGRCCGSRSCRRPARDVHRPPRGGRLRLDHDRRRRDRQRHPRHRRPGLGTKQPDEPTSPILCIIVIGITAVASTSDQARRAVLSLAGAMTDPRPPTDSSRIAWRPMTPHRIRRRSASPRSSPARSSAASTPTAPSAAPAASDQPTARRRRDDCPTDHDRLPAHPQRRPHRQARGLARGGLRPDVNIEWTAVRLGRLGQRGDHRRRHRHRPGRLVSPVSRGHLHRASSTRCRGSTTSSARPRRWSSGTTGDHRRRRPRRQDDRHAVRLDRPLQPAGRAARRRHRRRRDVKIIDPEPETSTRRGSTGDIDAAYVWNPNLAKLIAEGGDDPRHQRRPGRARARPPTTSAVVTNDFAEEYPDASRRGSRPRTGPSRCSTTTPTRPPRSSPSS